MSQPDPDRITEPKEWIDGLVHQYSPVAGDIDVALQNMGLRIAELEFKLDAAYASIRADSPGPGIGRWARAIAWCAAVITAFALSVRQLLRSIWG